MPTAPAPASSNLGDCVTSLPARRGVAALIGVVVAATGSWATADAKLVRVQAAGEPLAAEEIGTFICGRIQSLGLEATFHPVVSLDRAAILTPATDSDEPLLLARVWLDVRVDRATIYLGPSRTDPPSPRGQLLARVVRYPSGIDAVAREEIATIVVTALDTLRVGRPLGDARIEAARLLPSAPPTPLIAAREPAEAPRAVAATSPTFQLGAWAGGRSITRLRAQAASAGLSLLIEANPADRGSVHKALWIDAGTHAPFEVRGASGVARLTGAGAHVMGLLGLRLGARMAAGLGAGPGVELRSVRPVALPGAAAWTNDNTQRELIVHARLAFRASYLPTSALRVFVALVADVPLLQGRYHARGDDLDEVILDPLRVQVGVQAGLGWCWGGKK